MPRVIEAFAQFFDGNGDPLVDGWLAFLESGSNNTDKNTYSDVGETIANTNPVQLDAEGRLGDVFGPGSYRVILYTNDELLNQPATQIDMFDPVGGQDARVDFSDWNSTAIYSEGNIVTGSDGNYYRSLTNNNENNDPATGSGDWEPIEFVQFYQTNRDYIVGSKAIGSDGVWYDSKIANGPSSTTVNPVGDATGTWAVPSDYIITTTGTDTYTADGLAEIDGQQFTLSFSITNTGAATVNAVDLRLWGDVDIPEGWLRVGREYKVKYVESGAYYELEFIPFTLRVVAGATNGIATVTNKVNDEITELQDADPYGLYTSGGTLTVPAELDGALVSVKGGAQWNAVTDVCQLSTRVTLNDTLAIANSTKQNEGTSSGAISITTSVAFPEIRVSEGDYFELSVFQNSGISLVLSSDASNFISITVLGVK